MTALEQALKVWNDPKDLIAQWQNDETKDYQENLISALIGKSGSVVDLGCGVGRYANQLKGVKKYQGYDGSLEMIIEAKKLYEDRDWAEFACVDITSFQSLEKYDTALLIDVAYHQEDPIKFIKTVINLWDYKRLFFTFLVGDRHEVLYNSVVVSFLEFTILFGNYKINIIHLEQVKDCDFCWLVCKV